MGTTISFNLPTEQNISLEIFNIKGKKIKTLTHSKFSKGNHAITWIGDDDFGKPVSSGVYFYKLNLNNDENVIRKCLLLK